MKTDAKKTSSIGTLVLRLCVITLCAGFILGLVYSITKEPIAAQAAATANESRKQVLPDAAEFAEMDVAALVTKAGEAYGEIEEVYEGTDSSGALCGHTVAIRTKGYSANLCLTVGVDSAGIVTGVVITSHEETPGLGANANTPDFLGQYLGADGPLTVVKTEAGTTGEVQAITGATITSRAVTEAVNLARDFCTTCLPQ